MRKSKFAPASRDEQIVFGAERPGSPSKAIHTGNATEQELLALLGAA
jgi:hypothetical protein